MRLKLSLLAITVSALATTSQAVSWSSFHTVQFSGISVSSGAGGYTVSMDANPTMYVGNQQYAIEKLIGFYILSPSGSNSLQATLSPFTASGTSWKVDTKGNNAPYSLAGYHAQSASLPGIGASSSQFFSMTGVSGFSGSMYDYGFHVYLPANVNWPFSGSGNTGFARGTARTAVPGPAAVLPFVTGLIAARRRRRS